MRTYIIAEAGINHNGDTDIAKKLIDVAADCGCNAVKFQKRTPEICVPESQKSKLKETPWGNMTYLEYKKRIEFGRKEYDEIVRHCNKRSIDWFASCWDAPSIDFIEDYNPVAHKVPSAMLTNEALVKYMASKGRRMFVSTGMSTMNEIDMAVTWLRDSVVSVILMHTNSSYPCKPEEINLKMMDTLRKYDYPVGYSGHEVGLQISIAAAAMGAAAIERHITLDRSMWGTDQSASVEPQGLRRLVRDIRIVELAMGDGVKKLYDGEKLVRTKLRGN